MSQSDGASQPPAIGENPDLTLMGNRSDPRQNVSAPSATRTRDLLFLEPEVPAGGIEPCAAREALTASCGL